MTVFPLRLKGIIFTAGRRRPVCHRFRVLFVTMILQLSRFEYVRLLITLALPVQVLLHRLVYLVFDLEQSP